jgi:putative membrane protein insertion efficiency factor
MSHRVGWGVTVLALASCLLLPPSGWFCRAEVETIHLYQSVGAPLVGYLATCRYNPTCSKYALQVLAERGFWRGNLRLAQRLLSCSPVGLLFQPLFEKHR